MVSSHCNSLQVSLQAKTQVHEAQLCWDSMDMNLTDLSARRKTMVSGECSWGTTNVPHPHHGILTCTCGKAEGSGTGRKMQGAREDQELGMGDTCRWCHPAGDSSMSEE